MLPSTNPLVTAPAPLCLWNPSTAPLAAVLLLLNIWKPALNVVVAKMSSVLLVLLPSTVFPRELNTLP